MNHRYPIRKSKYEALSNEELNRLVEEDNAEVSTDPEFDPEEIKQKRIDEKLNPESDGSMFEPSEDSELIYPSDNEYEERNKKAKRFVKSMPPPKFIDSSSDNETEKNSSNNKRKKKFQKHDKIKFTKSTPDNVSVAVSDDQVEDLPFDLEPSTSNSNQAKTVKTNPSINPSMNPDHIEVIAIDIQERNHDKILNESTNSTKTPTPSGANSNQNKQPKGILSLAKKLEIIEMYERGIDYAKIASDYNMPESVVFNICEKKENYKLQASTSKSNQPKNAKSSINPSMNPDLTRTPVAKTCVETH